MNSIWTIRLVDHQLGLKKRQDILWEILGDRLINEITSRNVSTSPLSLSPFSISLV